MDYDEFDLLPDDTIEYLFEEFDYLNPCYCERCGCLWEREDIPVCPVCNAAVLGMVEQETLEWLDRQPHGDVLGFAFDEPGVMTVYEYNLDGSPVKDDD